MNGFSHLHPAISVLCSSEALEGAPVLAVVAADVFSPSKVRNRMDRIFTVFFFNGFKKIVSNYLLLIKTKSQGSHDGW